MKFIKLLRTFALVSLLHVIGSLASHFDQQDYARSAKFLDAFITESHGYLNRPSTLDQRTQHFKHIIDYLQNSPVIQSGCPGFDQQIKKQTLQKMDETAFAISTIALENIPNILAQVESCLKETAAAAANKPGPARGGAFEQAALEDLRIVQQGAINQALEKFDALCRIALQLKDKIREDQYISFATEAIGLSKDIVNILAAQNLIDPNQPGLESVYKEIEKMRANKQWGASLKAEALRNDVRVLSFELINKIFKKIKVSDLNINIPSSCMPEDGW